MTIESHPSCLGAYILYITDHSLDCVYRTTAANEGISRAGSNYARIVAARRCVYLPLTLVTVTYRGIQCHLTILSGIRAPGHRHGQRRIIVVIKMIGAKAIKPTRLRGMSTNQTLCPKLHIGPTEKITQFLVSVYQEPNLKERRTRTQM